MTSNTTAEKIQELRKQNNLTQDDFAKRLCTSRTTISNWEQGKCFPTTEQLIKMHEVFNTSADEILQIRPKNGFVCVLDTSAILRRPAILDIIFQNERIEKIIIPDTVISELNYQKDRGKRRQQAWLAMASIEKLRSKNPSRIKITNEKKPDGINDRKIIFAAEQVAKFYSNNFVYLLTEDIFFPLIVQRRPNPNLEIITLKDFDELFVPSFSEYDKLLSANFYAAIKKDDIKAAEKQKFKNTDVNYIDPTTGFTPLIQSIRNKSKPTFQYLLTCPEIDYDKCDNAKYRLPPICHAVQLDNPEMIEALISHGAKVDCQSQGKNKGNTALMMAAWHGRNDILKYLIQQGACTNQQDTNGYTALIKACIRGNNDSVKILLPLTDSRIRSFEGLDAKEYAARNKNSEIVELMKKEYSND